MAFEGNQTCMIGVLAGADLSAAQYTFGVLNSSGAIIKNATAGAAVEGVIQDDPTSGQPVCVAVSGASKVVYGGVVTAGDKLMSDASGKAVKATSTATAASKALGTGPYILWPANTIVVDVDNVGDATVTFDAAGATITDTTAYPCADQVGLTSLVTVAGYTQQTVTFVGATTTAAVVTAQMNAQLVGASAVVTGGQVVLTTDQKGTGATIACAAGTGGLTWAAPVAGTGDVVNIRAVTSAEVKTRVEADTTATVTVVGAGGTIYSPTTGITSELDFKSGAALTPLGLAVEVKIGTAAPTNTQFRGKALVSGVLNDVGTMQLSPTGTAD